MFLIIQIFADICLRYGERVSGWARIRGFPFDPQSRNIAAYEGWKKTDMLKGEVVSNQGKRGTKARSCPNSMSQLSCSQCTPPQCMILRHCLRRARHERVHRAARVPYERMCACVPTGSPTAIYCGVDFATRVNMLFSFFLLL